jgi:hypothetical protein
MSRPKAPYRLQPLHPPGETMQERLARLAHVEARTLVAIGYLEQRIAERRELGFRTLTEEADLYIARGTLDRVRAWMAEARMAVAS